MLKCSPLIHGMPQAVRRILLAPGLSDSEKWGGGAGLLGLCTLSALCRGMYRVRSVWFSSMFKQEIIPLVRGI